MARNSYQSIITWLGEKGLTEMQLEAFADRARVAFGKHRKAATGRGGYAATDTTWQKAAMAALDHDVTPEEWVDRLFLAYKPGYPYANMLYGKEADRRFKTTVVNATVIREAELAKIARLAEVFERRVREGASPEEALSDSRLNFPPEFIWCMAVFNEIPRLAGAYRAAAGRRLQRNSRRAAYEETFKEIKKEISRLWQAT